MGFAYGQATFAAVVTVCYYVAFLGWFTPKVAPECDGLKILFPHSIPHSMKGDAVKKMRDVPNAMNAVAWTDPELLNLTWNFTCQYHPLTASHSITQHDTVSRSTGKESHRRPDSTRAALHSTAQHYTASHSITEHNTALQSITQHYTALHSIPHQVFRKAVVD
jgi:hypothetical protein